MATWLSGVKRQSWGRDGGSFTTSPDKILLHSTETGSFPGYGGGASAPHFTIDLENGEVRQHSPMNRAARALRNASGGVQTNRDGVIQIEIIGTCDKSFARKHGYPYLPDMTDEMAGRLKWLLQKICAAIPAIPLTTSVAWKTYPSSYGNSSVRMSNSQWTRYKGILGHQHAPENTHGDPGDLPMKRILGADAVKSGGSSGGGSDYTVVGPDAPLGLYDKDGDGRTRVEDWQKDALGYSGKAADGYFGSDTKDDTKALQRQIGVTDDGLVGDDTTARVGEGREAEAREGYEAEAVQAERRRARPWLRLPLAQGSLHRTKGRSRPFAFRLLQEQKVERKVRRGVAQGAARAAHPPRLVHRQGQDLPVEVRKRRPLRE